MPLVQWNPDKQLGSCGFSILSRNFSLSSSLDFPFPSTGTTLSAGAKETIGARLEDDKIRKIEEIFQC